MDTFTFRKALFLISNHLSSSEVTTLKFYLADTIPRSQLEKAKTGFDIFCLIIWKGLLSPTELSFLEDILECIHKKHFVERYIREAQGVSGGQNPPVNLGGAQPISGRVDSLKKFLGEIGAELSHNNVHDLALFFHGDLISIQEVESIQSSAELFGKLLDSNILNQSNLHILKEVLGILGRKDLGGRVERYQQNERDGGNHPPNSIGGSAPPHPHLKKPVREVLKSPEECSEQDANDAIVAVPPGQVRSRDSHGSLATGFPSFTISNSSSRMDDLSLSSLEERDSVVGKELQLSLKITEKDKCIEKLETEITRLKKETSSGLELQRALQTKIHEVESLRVEAKKLRKTLDSVPLYQMKSRPHGRAIIIVNGKFNSTQPPLNDRHGAEKDKILLTQTFKHLDYITEVHENLKKAQMLDVMTKVSQANHSDYDSLVCCVSTHGTDKGIYGSDGGLVSREEFHGAIKNCPTLTHKPKLFFLQACRKPFVNADSPNESGNIPIPSQHSNIHPDTDMLIANASTMGHPAFISPWEGSWFVNALFQKLTGIFLPYERTLQQILQEVTNTVSTSIGIQQTDEEEKRVTQCVEVSSTLRAGVKFFDNQTPV